MTPLSQSVLHYRFSGLFFWLNIKLIYKFIELNLHQKQTLTVRSNLFA